MVRSRFLYVSINGSGDSGRYLPQSRSPVSDRSPRPRRPAPGIAARGDTERVAPRVGWRLIGPNNRELGRSAAVYASAAACRDAVVRLREGVGGGRARALLTMSDAAGTWTWRLEVGGHQAAVSARTYQRQREAQHNLSLFLAAVPLAEVYEAAAVASAPAAVSAPAVPGEVPAPGATAPAGEATDPNAAAR